MISSKTNIGPPQGGLFILRKEFKPFAVRRSPLAPRPVSRRTGAALMAGDFTVTLPEGKKAVIVKYTLAD